MNEYTEANFKQALEELQKDPQSGLTGPFIHSAPKGNMHRGPFSDYAWMIGKETVLRKAWTPETGWRFFHKHKEGE